MRTITLIAHNLRSCHNVGSLLRTAEGLGAKVLLTGYTPRPAYPGDTRLPHEVQKITKQLHKTALGAEKTADWEYHPELLTVLKGLRQKHIPIAALEQTPASRALPGYEPPQHLALIVGREVEGIEPDIVDACDLALEIPMFGGKESFNVTQAAAMALYHCRFTP